MKNILVGIDFHADTQKLIDKSLELAKAMGSKIWLLHVAAPEPDFVGYDVGPQYIRDFRAKELKEEHKQLSGLVEQIESRGIEADGLLIPGVTPEVVIDESKKLNIDLIVFGHHEHGILYKLFFGSHAAQIIQHSEIPVLVVPLKG